MKIYMKKPHAIREKGDGMEPIEKCDRCKKPVDDEEHYEFSANREFWFSYCLDCAKFCGPTWKYKRKIMPLENHEPAPESAAEVAADKAADMSALFCIFQRKGENADTLFTDIACAESAHYVRFTEIKKNRNRSNTFAWAVGVVSGDRKAVLQFDKQMDSHRLP